MLFFYCKIHTPTAGEELAEESVDNITGLGSSLIRLGVVLCSSKYLTRLFSIFFCRSAYRSNAEKQDLHMYSKPSPRLQEGLQKPSREKRHVVIWKNVAVSCLSSYL